MRSSKSNELQADSMGLLFCARAGYDVNTAMNILDVLDHADELRYPDTLPLEKIFNDEDFPFESYWLEKENLACLLKRDSIVGLTPDSLKTHPDCLQRREALSRMKVESQVKMKTDDEVDSLYRDFHWQYQFEMLATLMQVKDYPKALYTALNLQNEYPENLYLQYVVANTLIELGRLAASNDFLETVEFPDDQYSSGFNQILTFLQNLNSSAMEQLADHYLKKHKLDLESHPYGAYLKIISNPEKSITAEMVADYQKKFPGAEFDDLLMKKVVPEPVKSKK